MKLTEKDIIRLKSINFVEIKDDDDFGYSWQLELVSDRLDISYGKFSNPLNYKTIFFKDSSDILNIIRNYLIEAKENFHTKVNSPHMRYHYLN